MSEHKRDDTRISAGLRLLLQIGTRVVVWGTLFALLYLLRSFFLLIFLTFVFAYLQSHAVTALAGRIRPRVARVVLVGVSFLTLLIGLGFYIVPEVKHQAEALGSKFPEYIASLDRELEAVVQSHPFIARVLPSADPVQRRNHGDEESLAMGLFEAFLGSGEGTTVHSGGSSLKEAFGVVHSIGTRLFAVGSAFLLSLLFSFLIVLDLPRLTATVSSLDQSKLRGVYREVAPSIRTFAGVVGHALEAQFFIALLNSVLTGAGLLLLGLGENLAFLTLIVFLCSFIPVAGVVMSSAPICVLALQLGGWQLVFLSIALVLVVHFVEAYIINPHIFGHHLRINPVLVLIILTVFGKLFGVWGLVLGLPVCTYFFQHAIRDKAESREA